MNECMDGFMSVCVYVFEFLDFFFVMSLEFVMHIYVCMYVCLCVCWRILK